MHVSQFPEMCLFTTEVIFPESDEVPLDGTSARIIVTFTPPSPSPFSSPTEPTSMEVPLRPTIDGLDEVKIMMFSSPTVGYNMGPEYNDWFSSCFGYGIVFVYLGPNRREILGNMPPHVDGPQRELRENPSAAGKSDGGSTSWLSNLASSLSGYVTRATNVKTWPGVDEGISFADCAPFLIISTRSWENVNRRLEGSGEVMDISKFRPNIIIEGADEEFEEDFWAELAITPSSPLTSARTPTHGEVNGDQPNQNQQRQELHLILTQNCARCNSLNIDYKTGKVGTGAAGTILKKLQSDRRFDQGSKYSPVFGRYAFLVRVDGFTGTEAGGPRIRVGDEVRVVRRYRERSRFGKPHLLVLPGSK